MKGLLIVSALVSFMAAGGVAKAASGDSSFSLGWAQIHSDELRNYMGENFKLSSDLKTQMANVIKNEGKADSEMDRYKNLNGFNIKYRYEFNDEWGIISSITYAQASFDGNYYLSQAADKHYSYEGHIKSRYLNIMVGPAWRFNDYVSLYGMAGVAGSRTESSYSKSDHGYYGSTILNTHEHRNMSTTDISYGVGIETNPFNNIVLDLAYEGSAGSLRSSGFNVGLGYKF
ncbi:Ail/Lom family outer membrane beta-barrel protein [Salmonella enterica]|nr:Ail/Lom family outer membrane beta-barrel protein [Salmonella enterica]EGL7480384.1 Ail/Lom family outer membrane beta-barrel protein [Salmonella enterica]EIZ2335964.1 Ail/Lom family outer membrane beta-barrel protein [Salmonella enterica]